MTGLIRTPIRRRESPTAARWLGRVLLAGFAIALPGACQERSARVADPTTNASGSGEVEEWSPLETLLYGGAKRNDKVRVAMAATEACMHSRGWSSFVGSASIVTLLPDKASRDRADATLAYGVTAPDPEPPFDPNAKWVSQLGPSEAARFDADLWQNAQERNGCMQSGSLAGFGNLAIADPELSAVTAEVGSRIDSSPETQQLRSEWHACLSDRGFDHQSPDAVVSFLVQKMSDAANDLGRKPRPGDASWEAVNKLEHQLYEADIKCRASLDYDRRMFHIRVRVESAVIEAHPGLVTYRG